ncbi:MAG: urease accessory protein UreD [Cyanobacteria bacterium J06648_16]
MVSTPVHEPIHDPAASTAWHGRAALTFVQTEGKTWLDKNWTQAPLKVLRSHYPEGPTPCYTTLVHTAGGMVGGDRLSQSITLEPNTRALITTPAAAKIYSSKGSLSTVSTRISVNTGAALEWLPQETIVFAGAQYHQTLRVNLSERATVLLWDVTRFGRSARGEAFTSGDWRSDIEVWRAGKPLWIDRQSLDASTPMRLSPAGLNDCPVVGTLALVGQSVSEADIDNLRVKSAALPIEPEAIGITTSLSGIVCRYRGHSSQTARQFFTTVWQQLRATQYGKIPPVPRVWI